jgi:hypothetical protein
MRGEFLLTVIHPQGSPASEGDSKTVLLARLAAQRLVELAHAVLGRFL